MATRCRIRCKEHTIVYGHNIAFKYFRTRDTFAVALAYIHPHPEHVHKHNYQSVGRCWSGGMVGVGNYLMRISGWPIFPFLNFGHVRATIGSWAGW